jgi:hypothetical protein
MATTMTATARGCSARSLKEKRRERKEKRRGEKEKKRGKKICATDMWALRCFF